MSEVEFAHPVPTQEEVNEWYELDAKISVMKAREMQLRVKIAQGLFKNPKEGVNNLPLPDAWVMKMGYVLNRNLDVGQAIALQDEFVAAKIPVADIIVQKPTFVLSVYRDLTAEQQKIFDKCLVTKPGAPSLEIVKPKRPVKT